MKPDDFIKTARSLVSQQGAGRPRETDLRRAVSTAYYALFHCVASSGADLLVGGKQADRSERAWRQAYRALNHGQAKNRCREITGNKRQMGFPAGLEEVALEFVNLQRARHRADYDPTEPFIKSDVLQTIRVAERAMAKFTNAERRDRTAFVVFMLLGKRSDD